MGRSKSRSHSKDRDKEKKKENLQKLAKKMRDLESRLKRALQQQDEEEEKNVSKNNEKTEEPLTKKTRLNDDVDISSDSAQESSRISNDSPIATQNQFLPSDAQISSADSVPPSQTADDNGSGKMTVPENTPSVSSLDEETLKLLGDDPGKDESQPFVLQQDLAQRWKGWISSGLKKDMLEELLKKYGRSGNCHLDAPKLNPEIEATLSEVTAKRDKHFVQSQKIIGSAMAALGTAITSLLVNNEEGIDRLQLLENLCDSGNFLAAAHFKESLARRAFISLGINKPLRCTLDESKPDSFLYGSDFQVKIKEAKSIVKVGDDLKTKPPPKQQAEKPAGKKLNFKGPPAKTQNYPPVGDRQHFQPRRRFPYKNQSNSQGKENREKSDKRPPAKR